MKCCQLFNRLDFHDYCAFYQQVDPVAAVHEDEGSKPAGQLIVTSCDPAEVLYATEEALNAVPGSLRLLFET